MQLRFAVGVAVMTLAGASGLTLASTPYSVSLTSYTYGTLDQNYESNNFGPTACAPTSTANSFYYLQNRYGFNLVPHGAGNTTADDLSAVVNTLGGLMGTNANGTTDQNMVNGKIQYIQDKGLGNSISVEAQGNNLTAQTATNIMVQHTTPTWQFLYEQLTKGQDVEVGFNWGDGGAGGHWVTATGFNFTDANDNSTIDAGEAATMSFIDPWGGVSLTGNLSMGTGTNSTGHLVLSYSGGAAGDTPDPLNPTDANNGFIDIIVAESPVPEPATLAVLGVGAGMLLTRRRRM